MNRKIKIMTLITMVIWGLAVINVNAHPSSMYIGNIQFPSTLTKTPTLRIYFAGNKLACKRNDEKKNISFNVTPIQHNMPLYILVIKKVQWQSDENIIKYLKVNPQKAYRLYRIAFNTNNGTWHIQEEFLDEQGKIPDNTIIIISAPEWIEKIEGGNTVTLPTIYIQSTIMDQFESEEALTRETESLLLGAIDSDSIHKKTEQMVKPHYKIKTVLALTT